MADLHVALKSECLIEHCHPPVEFKLMRLHHGKNNVQYSLHARPRTWTSSSGPHTPDLLAMCGFRRGNCNFFGLQCFAREVAEGFDLPGFIEAFNSAYQQLKRADSHLRACGIFHHWPEGASFFTGGRHLRHRPRSGSIGDGHRLTSSRELKSVGDDSFRYVLSWGEMGYNRGWLFHIHAKRELSPSEAGALTFLKLAVCSQCPFHDFERCYWFFVEAEDTMGIRRAEVTHKWLEACVADFPQALGSVVGTHDLVEQYGLGFLKIPKPPLLTRLKEAAGRKLGRALPSPASGALTLASNPLIFVAYVEDDEEHARALHAQIRAKGYKVWCGAVDLRPGDRWDEIIQRKLAEAHIFIVLVSKHPATTDWYGKEYVVEAIEHARNDSSKVVLPVLLNGASPRHLPLGLKRVTPVIARTNSFAPVVKAIRSRIS